MKSGIPSLKTCACMLTLLACAAAAQAATLTPAEYRRQLESFNTRIEQISQHPKDAAAFQAEIPDKVTVSDGPREYSLSYDWMKQILKQYLQAEPQKRSTFLKIIQDKLQ